MDSLVDFFVQSRAHLKALRQSPRLIKERSIYVFIVHCRPIAARRLIQKITVAYLIVLFNICILFHFLFSDCAPISTFYSWRPTPRSSCTFLSMSFLTFCWFTLRWAAEVDAGRSSSIEELGFGLCFMGSEGDQGEEDCVGSSFCFCINARQEPPPALSPSPPFAFLWSVLQLMECCSGCCSSPPCTSFCRHSLNPMRHAAFSIHVIPKPCPGVWTSALVQSSNRQMIPHSHLRPQLNPNSKFESESESLPKTTVHSQLGAGVALFHWNNKWCP